MIKQIQFRGISRTPSDRMVDDGGCSESLNVQMDNTEVAPACMPEDVTTARVGEAAVTGTDDYIYIHKGSTYSNYITLGNGTVKAYIDGVQSEAIVTFDQDETFRSASSIGNTLLLVTDKHMHYVLFKEGVYIYLGTKIPEPSVQFDALPVNRTSQELQNRQYSLNSAMSFNEKLGLMILIDWTPEAWNQIAAKYDTDEIFVSSSEASVTYRELVDLTSEFLWSKANNIINTNRANGIFTQPVFIRYAVKLYDGSYIYQSVPYLLHCRCNQNITFTGLQWDDDGREGTDKIFELYFYNEFRAKANIDYEIGDWKDIVKGVDIFLSTDITNPKLNSRIIGADRQGETFVNFFFNMLGQTGNNQPKDVKDEILSKSLFYKVLEINSEEISGTLEEDIKPLAQDELLVKQRLEEDYYSSHETIPSGTMMTYNQRLVMAGMKTRLYTGYPYLLSVAYVRANTHNEPQYSYVFHVRASDGSTYNVIARNIEGGITFTPKSITLDQNEYIGVPRGWLYYPDPRCYKVDIYCVSDGDETATKYTIQMQEHPYLNGAYALCSLGLPVQSLKEDTPLYDVPLPSTENNLITEDNGLAISELSNPFLLPAEGRLTFDYPIISVATTTKALSSGQFGQFPIYVFTKGGIWAVELDNTGLPVTSKPLSRDVATSADSVTPIDQAIVFATDKSVLLLEGSQITDIAPYMSGRQFADGIADSVLTMLGEWSSLSPVLLDRTPFMKYMEDAHGVYDYPGRRLIFFSKTFTTFQYVYLLSSQTWHKLAIGDVTLGTILNSYPEAFISAVDGETGYRKILDFSTNLKTSTTALRGVIITRPLALDATDVRKAVTALRFRGVFHFGHVKYKLLASMDGITWGELRTLRGGSYRLFRLVILTNLQPAERLSYVDMDYEKRLTNRMR